jgi:hypothetical protein
VVDTPRALGFSLYFVFKYPASLFLSPQTFGPAWAEDKEIEAATQSPRLNTNVRYRFKLKDIQTSIACSKAASNGRYSNYQPFQTRFWASLQIKTATTNFPNYEYARKACARMVNNGLTVLIAANHFTIVIFSAALVIAV